MSIKWQHHPSNARLLHITLRNRKHRDPASSLRSVAWAWNALGYSAYYLSTSRLHARSLIQQFAQAIEFLPFLDRECKSRWLFPISFSIILLIACLNSFRNAWRKLKKGMRANTMSSGQDLLGRPLWQCSPMRRGPGRPCLRYRGTCFDVTEAQPLQISQLGRYPA